MAAGLESEIKLGIREPDGLDVLLRWLPEPTSVQMQRSHFYDTADGVLRAARIMLRVREEGPVGASAYTPVAAAKRRKSRSKAARFVAEEIECELSPELWADVLSGAVDFGSLRDNEAIRWVRTEVPDLGPLYRLGAVENVRTCVSYEDFMLEVDHTTFPDGSVDCEIEVETLDIDGARLVVTAAATAAGVTLFDQTKGKHRRFRERLDLSQ